MSSQDRESHARGAGVTTIPSGGAAVFDARLCLYFSIITDATCTVTYSRVDSPTASAHTTGAANQGTLTSGTILTLPVDWPWYRISTSGGTCRVSLL